MMRYRIATVGGHRTFYRETDPCRRERDRHPYLSRQDRLGPGRRTLIRLPRWHDRREVSRIFLIASSVMRGDPSFRYPHVLPEKMG